MEKSYSFPLDPWLQSPHLKIRLIRLGIIEKFVNLENLILSKAH
jgi:hypothetical protein